MNVEKDQYKQAWIQNLLKFYSDRQDSVNALRNLNNILGIISLMSSGLAVYFTRNPEYLIPLFLSGGVRLINNQRLEGISREIHEHHQGITSDVNDAIGEAQKGL